MARLFVPAKKVRVQTDTAGEVSALHWQGRWERARVYNRWRLEDDWWRPGGEVVREYRKLRTESSLVCVVYRDEITGEWYLEKILD